MERDAILPAEVTATPRPGESLPFFDLPSTHGEKLSPWRYKGRRNVVLVFANDGNCADCERLLREFAARYFDYAVEEAEVLGIVTLAPAAARELAERLHLPFPLLSDGDGAVHRRYSAGRPAVFVADRYGEIYERWGGGAEEPLPAQEDVLDRLRFIEIQCPE